MLTSLLRASETFLDILIRWENIKSKRNQVKYFCVTVQRVSPAAEPNGHIIESVDVQSLGPSTWAVSLKPASCGTGIQLLEIANAEVVGGNTSSNRAVFRSVNATGNFTIIISREHPATPPIGGTFKISFEDEHLEGNEFYFLKFKTLTSDKKDFVTETGG